jgi:glycosyltransferase involved in cell wall biosynthesis
LKVIQAVGWYFPDTIGGTEIYVDALARRYRDAGIETLVAAPRAGATTTSEYVHDGTPVFRYGIPVKPTRAEARGDETARGADAFHRWLGQQQPDVVHFHTFVTGLDLAEVRAARATGARVFVTTHSSALGYLCLRGTMMRWGRDLCDGVIRPRTCAACALQARGIPRVAAAAATALPRRTTRQLDRFDHPLGTVFGLPAYLEQRQDRQHALFESVERFFVLTDQARRALLANGAPDVRVGVNRLGVDMAILRRNANRTRVTDAPITIGFLARFDPVKGLDDLLDAIQLLPPQMPARFDIRGVSDQPASSALLSRARRMASRDARLTLGGPVRREDIGDVLASWDVLCCPGKSLEGGPTVALEALAVGTPVIATSIGGIAEVLADGVNGALVRPGDATALAAVFRTIATRPELLQEWRSALPPVRTMDDVAADYLREYAA